MYFVFTYFLPIYINYNNKITEEVTIPSTYGRVK